jgi:hypothetical protein
MMKIKEPEFRQSRFLTHRHLNRRPRIQIDRLDLWDVDAQVAVDPGALDAQEKAKVPRRPTGTWKKAE